MPSNPPTTTTFLRAMQRRLILTRALEFAGAGTLIASSLGLVLLIAALCSGTSVMFLPAALIPLGALVGAATSLLRLPTMMHAAAEADRQLDLADLLGTALAAQANVDDPW